MLGWDHQGSNDYLSRAKLDVEFTDLVQIPEKLWVENVAGHSALACWSTGNSVY